jgi:Tfp pilus assembly protein PilF
MVLVQTAEGHMDKGNFQAAVRVLQEAVAVRPELVEAQYQLASALQRAGDERGSEQQFRQLVRAHPDHAQAHLGLGILLSTEGSKREAVAELQNAVRLAPSLVEAHESLAELAKEEKDWPAAIREYEAVLAWKPGDAVVRRDLNLALKAAGREDSKGASGPSARSVSPN